MSSVLSLFFDTIAVWTDSKHHLASLSINVRRLCLGLCSFESSQCSNLSPEISWTVACKTTSWLLLPTVGKALPTVKEKSALCNWSHVQCNERSTSLHLSKLITAFYLLIPPPIIPSRLWSDTRWGSGATCPTAISSHWLSLVTAALPHQYLSLLSTSSRAIDVMTPSRMLASRPPELPPHMRNVSSWDAQHCRLWAYIEAIIIFLNLVHRWWCS